MKSGFLDKLIGRLDRLDPESLQVHFLRLAQERGLLETIFQSIQEGVIAVDGEGRLTYANRAAECLLGFSLEKSLNRHVSRYIRGIDWDGILDLDVSEWTKLISHEIEITYPEHRFLNFYVVPLFLEQEGDGGALIILRDVTLDRQQEASVLESERLNAVKLLAAGVAHEIGNPLNALNIHLQLLDRELKQLDLTNREDLRQLVTVAKDEVTRLDLIITQFLRAIRPSEPNLALSEVNVVLEGTLALLRQEIEDRNIDVQVEYTGSVPKVHLDKDQIKQAFFNIIRNALQAMPDGGSLGISVSSAKDFLVISFKDSGSGIPPEDFGRMFQPYYTTKSSGSGLGLMIVQRIVQDHGGQIKVVSEPDVGTTFSILLPLTDRRVRLLKARPGGEEGKSGDLPPVVELHARPVEERQV